MPITDCLAQTGAVFPLIAIIAAIAVVAVGALLIVGRRKRSRAVPFLLLAPLALGGLLLSQSPAPAYAAETTSQHCGDDSGALPPATDPAGNPPTTDAPPTTPPATTPPTMPPTTPTPCPPAPVPSDKSETADTDDDGIVDTCDLDSDNDGILDSEEDFARNGLYEDDDVDGDLLIIARLGDEVSSYHDLDSENDGVPDLMEGRPFTRAQIDAFDADHDGILDPQLSFGSNGLLDDLETAPDSGVLKPELLPVRNTDGDDKPDFIDLTSNGTDFDLYTIGRSDLDQLGGGFITPLVDADSDGIMDAIDTDTALRGAPGSPYSPYSS